MIFLAAMPTLIPTVSGLVKCDPACARSDTNESRRLTENQWKALPTGRHRAQSVSVRPVQELVEVLSTLASRRRQGIVFASVACRLLNSDVTSN